MQTHQSFKQTIIKLKRFAQMLESCIFEKQDEISMAFYQTKKPLHKIPDLSLFGPSPQKWGGEGMYGWFIGDYTIPDILENKELFFWPKTGFYEATLWVDGHLVSNYANRDLVNSHGSHYCNRIVKAAKSSQKISIALECYAFHDVPGTKPFEETSLKDYTYPVSSNNICTLNKLYKNYLFDLNCVLKLYDALPETSFRKAELRNTLHSIHKNLYYSPDNIDKASFDNALLKTQPLLKEQLSKSSSNSAPYVGLIGHSHMDTAWLWPITETEKKCIRTYANQMDLMDEYPDYTFIQSSAFHSDIIKRLAPDLFKRIKKRISEGRYEPNGGAWIECDCNITGGEAMIRQFVWGQRFTQKEFNYKSDSFWLPDTFGYSYAIPQILKGCGIDYFLTTKMAWNDTNIFPYTSFLWQGLDGTQVLTHLNRTQLSPEPKSLLEITSGDDAIHEKSVSDMRLLSFGKGDGGGGPEFESLEMAKRLHDTEGLPKNEYTTVSKFMHKLEKSINNPSIYAGELYLELHRGTLTNQHQIKHNNRYAELAMHSLELITVQRAIENNISASGESFKSLWNTLLINQFHDILPGTCIHSAHVRSRTETTALINEARDQYTKLANPDNQDSITVYNSTSFERTETIELPLLYDKCISGYNQQISESIDGMPILIVENVKLPAFGSTALYWKNKTHNEEVQSNFDYCSQSLDTPFAHIIFSENGNIISFWDKSARRELCDSNGFGLNTFLLCEDVPADWDNWDIDADEFDKFAPTAKLLSRNVISNGSLELRIRSTYQLTKRSTLEQDMIFRSNTPRIDFDTIINWNDDHRFMKTAFDTSLLCNEMRNEIQFGCINRSIHRGTSTEKAKFEVCNHKYTDLSETNYGVSILNDCKYGVSAEEGHVHLSLHKGGCRPDREGDHGLHRCRYAFLPHKGGFSAENVVRPAYAYNHLPILWQGYVSLSSLLCVDATNIIVETVKPCEDTQKAYILRIYESIGAYTHTLLKLQHQVVCVQQCNMLEEEMKKISENNVFELTFKPFEIKTIKVYY